ncbi:hypothetical protein DRO69_08865 [Candidatus Bathyarchaeota archaeon]|nr:MAG: hypothetical protein DRO69_08865 [Candidatus Bathyarchaeota archaeon]
MRGVLKSRRAISRVLAIVFIVIIVVTLIGAVYYLYFAPRKPKEVILTVAYTGDIHTLDPLMAVDTDSDEIIVNVYDTLVTYPIVTTEDGKLVTDTSRFAPMLATSWNISSDFKEYTFKLREGVTFHSGHKFNATAVKYTFERLKNYGWGVIYGNIKSVDIIDEYTVKITLNKSDPLFMHYIALYSSSILDPWVMEEHGGPDPSVNTWLASNECGTGPFILEEWTPGEEIILRANENYWAGAPKIDKVIIKIITDATTVEAMLERGELDGPIECPYHIPEKDVERLSQVEGLVLQEFVNPAEVTYLIINTQIPPFNNTLVRKAIAYAVPKADIIEAAVYGLAVEAKSILGIGMEGYNGSFWTYTYNLTKAKELLTQAGYPNGFKTTAYLPTGYERDRVVLTLLQNSLKQIGIELDIREVAAATYWDLIWTGKAPIVVMSWPSFVNDPFYHLKFLLSSSTIGPGGNWAFYNNSKVDALLEEGYYETNVTRRQEILNELQRIVAEDVPYIPLWHTKFVYIMRSNIKGFVFFVDTLTRYYYIEKE